MTSTDASPHFRILDAIARDLSGELNFPTCMDAAVLVRNALHDPFASIERIVQAIGVEPLISSKLLRLANSVAFNPSGRTVTELAVAVNRLGFEAVRTTSLAVALDQMLKSKKLAACQGIARKAWEHSVEVAAIARVLARRLGGINPDEAMLAGLVHDIGIFYLLYRAADYPEYGNNEGALIELLVGWHESLGESLLEALGLPETITCAIRDHDRQQDIETPCTVRDVIYFANLLAGSTQEWLPRAIDPDEEATLAADRARYADLLAEAEEDIRELHAALAA